MVVGQSNSTAAGSWHVYLLRCADGTLYAGITTDLQRRLAEHNGERPGGARYTRARRPVELVRHLSCKDRAEASRRERALKDFDRATKKAWSKGEAEL